MNKQELIKKIKEMPIFATTISKIALVKQHEVIKLIEQLNQPQEVKVQQFVADWYEANKDDFEGNLFRCAHNIPSTFDGAKLNEFERWFLNASIKAFQTLVNMYQFGYTVEVEKRYRVRIKSTGQCLGKYYINNEILSPRFIYTGRNADEFTRKELEEAGFGWVFSCEGIEVEEIE